MNSPQIRFDDGASYETYMGVWSQSVGDAFLRWLAPAPGWRWADVGCGNAAFTEMLVERCAPAEVQGIDPAEAQIEFARDRFPAVGAGRLPGRRRAGPALGRRPLRRSGDGAGDLLRARPGEGGGRDGPRHPARRQRLRVRLGHARRRLSLWAMLDEMKAMGIAPPGPPSEEASRLETMRSLWENAGLVNVETRRIEVQRSFESFERFWEIAQTGPRVAARIAEMGDDDRARLRDGLRRRLPVDAEGRLTYGAWANAIKGRFPG